MDRGKRRESKDEESDSDPFMGPVVKNEEITSYEFRLSRLSLEDRISGNEKEDPIFPEIAEISDDDDDDNTDIPIMRFGQRHESEGETSTASLLTAPLSYSLEDLRNEPLITQYEELPRGEASARSDLFLPSVSGYGKTHSSAETVYDKIFMENFNREVFITGASERYIPVLKRPKPNKNIRVEEQFFICSLCNRVFTKRNSLRLHLRCHTGGPFECKRCSKVFSQRSNLKLHMRVHRRVFPFRCGVCNSAYRYESNLLIHLRLHTEIEPFKCLDCDEQFCAKKKFVKHLEKHGRARERILKCSDCDKEFVNSIELFRHLRLHNT